MLKSANRRIALVAVLVTFLDQSTKYFVNRSLGLGEEKVIIDGFFKFVNWSNTGAAWSMFTGKNAVLAVVALIALYVLFKSRHHFDAHTSLGQLALGLIFGGIVGNLIDRIHVRHVTDFLYFYLQKRGSGRIIDFPAFNIADSAICIGVFLIFLLSWRNDKVPAQPAQPQA